MEELWKHYDKWKKSDTIDNMLYDSINMKCSDLANPYKDRKYRSGFKELEESGWGEVDRHNS